MTGVYFPDSTAEVEMNRVMASPLVGAEDHLPESNVTCAQTLITAALIEAMQDDSVKVSRCLC